MIVKLFIFNGISLFRFYRNFDQGVLFMVSCVKDTRNIKLVKIQKIKDKKDTWNMNLLKSRVEG